MIFERSISVSKVRLFTLISAFMALAGCGGGSAPATTSPNPPPPPTTLSGTFIDSPVEGIGYRTESIASGATNSQGRFSYLAGESVTFFIGNLDFPTTPAHEVVTPFDLAGTTDVSNPTVINIARLLQSLDENGDPNDGITIPDTAADVATQLDFDQATTAFEADPNVINLVAGATNSVLIDQGDAIAHLSDSMLFLALDGGTIVSTGVDQGANIAVAQTLWSGGTFEDLANDDFGQRYDAESNSYEAIIEQGTWTLDGDLFCSDDSHPGVDCWYLTLSGSELFFYTDAAKDQLAWTDTVYIAERIDSEKLPGIYRLTIDSFDDECNLQVECYFEFSADGTFTEWEFDEVDQTSNWVIDDNGNMRMDWYEVDGTQRGVLRFYMKNAVGTDNYEEFGMVIYADLWDEPFPVMLGATLTRVE